MHKNHVKELFEVFYKINQVPDNLKDSVNYVFMAGADTAFGLMTNTIKERKASVYADMSIELREWRTKVLDIP